MKKQRQKTHPIIFILILIALVLLSIAVVNPTQPPQDPPPTQEINIAEEVGSTDGITVIAFIISGVILLPLLTSGVFTRKKKTPQK